MNPKFIQKAPPKINCSICMKPKTPFFIDGYIYYNCCSQLIQILDFNYKPKPCNLCDGYENPQFNLGITHYYCIDCDNKFY